MRRSDYLTVREAADTLRVTRQRVHFMLASGVLPFMWVGAQRVIRRDEFEARYGAKIRARQEAERIASSQAALPIDAEDEAA
jgi:excisionase family DNA binding protein